MVVLFTRKIPSRKQLFKTLKEQVQKARDAGISTYAIAVKNVANTYDKAIAAAGGADRVKSLPSPSTASELPDIYLGMDGVDCECELSLYIH